MLIMNSGNTDNYQNMLKNQLEYELSRPKPIRIVSSKIFKGLRG